MTGTSAPNTPCALILAAGYGSRLGGRGKALLRLGTQTLLERAVNSLRQGGITDIRVVTGHRKEDVAQAAAQLGIASIHNAFFDQGMFTSVQAGLAQLVSQAAVPASAPAVFILPVDAPLLLPESLWVLTAAWRQDTAQSISIPSFAGRSGHPPLIGAAHWHNILHWQGGQGLRGYLASLLDESAAQCFRQGKTPVQASVPGPLHFVSLPDAGICADMDTPSDYAAAQNFLTRTRERRDPSPEECRELLLYADLPLRTLRHCVAVARGALRLGVALNNAGKACTLDWHLSGGLLHDVARQHKDHALRGRQILETWGWQGIARIVGAHTTLPPALLHSMGLDCHELPIGGEYWTESSAVLPQTYTTFSDPSPELQHACIAVYLADKLYQGDLQVTLEERFTRVCQRFAGDPTALKAIQGRKATALAVADWFRTHTGTEAEACVRTSHNPDPLEGVLTTLSADFENAPGLYQPQPHQS